MKLFAFDSGVGGLSAIAPFLRQAKEEVSLTYFGDLANLPYGTKSPEHIRELVRKNLEHLLLDSYDLAILACNTASAHALDVAKSLTDRVKTPLVGVIEASCKAAVASKAKRVLVLGTGATVKSESYLRTLRALKPDIQVAQVACPLFVPLVEDLLYEGEIVEAVARRYLDSVVQPGDAVVLGCTHYPFLLGALSRLYQDVAWVDAGTALLSQLELKSWLAPTPQKTPNYRLNLLFSDNTLSLEKVHHYAQQLGLDASKVTLKILRAIS